MTRIPEAGQTRQALRAATMESHQVVDAIYAGFALDSAVDYRAFLTAHARALGGLEPAARPDAPRLPLLAQDLAALDLPVPDPLPLAQSRTDGFHWGLRYALEGSRLGGAMLSRQVAPGLPKAYLSAAHGKGEWIAFQQALDSAAMEGGEGWLDDAVQGAQAAFALFAQAGRASQVVGHG
ncbi:biliverdin-producing heme oxygenase [Sphingobium cupriresistens]|uniref:Heme oxygenase n=2 Tax=Sphingobium cupriresistens TaxID=1132417 RepID=A0A0J7Y0M4_9SPHN|nr:heme oxygenase [Sphingobium cupriresistens LL01]